MSVPQQDTELIELWLDGELPESQVDALRRRISTEPQLAQEVDRLRSDRQMRAGIWSEIEPADGQVEKLVSTVRLQARKDELRAARMRTLKGISSIAASVVLLFGAGWISHGRISVGPVYAPQPPSELVSAQNPQPNLLLVPPNPNRISTQRPTYKVQVVDPVGRVIAQGDLDHYDDAYHLARYVAQYNPTGEGVPQPPGDDIVPVNSREK